MRQRPIPQYAVEPIGITTYINGQLADPDNAYVWLNITNSDNGTVVVSSGNAVHESTGTFQYTTNSSQTAVQGNYAVTWNYTISGSPRIYVDNIVITDQMPYWSNLGLDTRQLVTGIVHRLDKSFDSTAGGPYLQELNQSGFLMYEEVAMVMQDETMDYINFEFQPIFSPCLLYTS